MGQDGLDGLEVEVAQDPSHHRPYLSREETDERLQILGITTQDRRKIVALEELLAGAIADWAEIEPETTFEELVAELQEWSEEYLFG